MQGPDDAGVGRRPLLAEDAIPIGPIVGLVVGVCVVGLGLHRLSGGVGELLLSWVGSPLLVGVIASALRAIREFDRRLPITS